MDLLSRSEFLQLSSLLAGSAIMPQILAPAERESTETGTNNIIILVFDAFSGSHLPIYGYPRNTTPNITRFADKATVYHNHYAGGSYTSPGTASLLTGTYPFTHRTFQVNKQTIPEFTSKNAFSLFDDYYRIAYSHNGLAATLLSQFNSSIDYIKPRQDLYINSNHIINKYLINDSDIAQVSWTRIFNQDIDHYSNSLFLSNFQSRLNENLLEKYQTQFPRGLPSIGGKDLYFILEHAISWISDHLPTIKQPFLGYFHLMPPHNPYCPSSEFIDIFAVDGYKPIEKREHLFSRGYSQSFLNLRRQYYDEYILYTDNQFNSLYKSLEDSDILENTWIILTSDHGELFERGLMKHFTEVLYQDVVHIPLIIHSPGQEKRQDVFTTTSAVDILPTILYLTGKQIPSWCEGEVLPKMGKKINSEKKIFTLDAKRNKPLKPINTASTMLIKWPYKLVEYRGYEKLRDNDPLYEMYDLEADAEELENIYSPSDTTARKMVEELRDTINKADEPYT